MLNCKDVTELASKRLDVEISGWQKLAMNIHLLVCNNCRAYVKHLEFLQSASKAMLSAAHGPRLSERSRRRIAEKLRSSARDTD